MEPEQRVSMDSSRIVEITDEREPLAERALGLISASFPPDDRHPMSELRSELAEKRLGLLDPFGYHLLARIDEQGRVSAAAAGVYLAGVNAGFVTYLAVSPEFRGQRLGRVIRAHLVEEFRADAQRAGRKELGWVMGEVRIDSLWLRSLVRNGGAVPFDLTYYHPGMVPGVSADRYALYREPHGDRRRVLPAVEVRQIIYAVWRRAYRVSYPLERGAFRSMIADLEAKETVGMHPEFIRE